MRTTIPASSSEQRSGAIERRAARRRARSARRVALLRDGGAPGHHRRRRRALLRGMGRAAGVRRSASASRSARRSPARAPSGSDSPLLLGGVGVEGNPAAGAIAAEADLVICVGTRLTDFATGSQSLFQHPDVRFIIINVCGHDASSRRPADRRRRARGARRAAPAAARDAGVRPEPHYLGEIAARAGRMAREDARPRASRHDAGEAMSQGS